MSNKAYPLVGLGVHAEVLVHRLRKLVRGHTVPLGVLQNSKIEIVDEKPSQR